MAEVRHFTSNPRNYEWVVEGDITACFDEISHPALMDRVRKRIGDKRVLALVKAFLKAGILSRATGLRETHTGTPQGGILSPLLSNIALSVLDDHFVGEWDGWSRWQRERRRREGLGVWRFVRYADDFVILVRGDRRHAEALREQTAAILAPMGLRLSQAKTLITHIDEGLDFLGWRIQRRRRPGDSRRFVYTYPSKKALASIVGKVKKICRHDPNLELAPVLHQLNRALRGWTAYFRPGVSFATFAYLRAFTWRQGDEPAPPQTPPDQLEGPPPPLLRRRLVAQRRRGDLVQPDGGGHHPLPLSRNTNPFTVAYRGMRIIPTHPRDSGRAGCGESRTSGSGGGPQKRADRKISTALRSDLTWSRSATGRSGTGPSTPRSGSTWTATKTSSASGRATAVASRPSTGSTCSPSCATGAWQMCSSSSVTG